MPIYHIEEHDKYVQKHKMFFEHYERGQMYTLNLKPHFSEFKRKLINYGNSISDCETELVLYSLVLISTEGQLFYLLVKDSISKIHRYSAITTWSKFDVLILDTSKDNSSFRIEIHDN